MDCPKGYYCNVNGMEDPYSCPSGYYANETGLSSGLISSILLVLCFCLLVFFLINFNQAMKDLLSSALDKKLFHKICPST